MGSIRPQVGFRASCLVLATLFVGCGSGDGAGEPATGPAPAPLPTPPATTSTFSVTLASVEAVDGTTGDSRDVSGLPIGGARATLE